MDSVRINMLKQPLLLMLTIAMAGPLTAEDVYLSLDAHKCPLRMFTRLMEHLVIDEIKLGIAQMSSRHP